MENLYPVITEINIVLYSFIGCFLALIVFYCLIQYHEKGISPLMVFRGQRYAFMKQIHAKIQELLAEGKTTDEVKTIIRNMQFPIFVNNPPCTNDNVDFVRNVISHDEILEQFLFPLIFKYDDFRKLQTCFNEDKMRLKAMRAVQLLLNDESGQNVDRMLHLLVDIHTRPFVMKRRLDISVPAGRNEMAVFQALSDLKVLKKTCTPQMFGSAMAVLMENYPSMDVLKGRSTIYYHADRITSSDKEFKEIVAINKQYIEEKMK